MTNRTVGVEEEFLLVDASGERIRTADNELAAAMAKKKDPAKAGEVQSEFKREQAETNTPPCLEIGDLGGQLVTMRQALAAAVEPNGVGIAAVGTSPLKVQSTTTDNKRYHAMADEYAILAREQLSCGCHVHVAVDSREEGVAVLDRIRPWLSVLAAISGNSPFWQGQDSGYSSYRTMVWGRWPSAGPSQTFGSLSGYEAAVNELVESGGLLDLGMIYFDARLSDRYPTVEIRVADVCIAVEDTVLIAALCRGLVETAANEWRSGMAMPPVRIDLLRAASWRAARHGLSGDLVDVVNRRAVPAWKLIAAMVDYISPALEKYGDLELVRRSLAELRKRGTGADLQRRSLRRRGRLSDVLLDAMERTVADPYSAGASIFRLDLPSLVDVRTPGARTADVTQPRRRHFRN